MPSLEPLRLGFDVACSAERAFALWTQRTVLWWPPGHTVSGAPAEIVFEPFAGGRIFERTEAGEEHDWGQVVEITPPRRLAYRWHLRQDPQAATDVEITFTATETGTRVEIVHGGWHALAQRERNEHGWSGLLPAFRRATTSPAPG
jgi:uncharacterized protein YndB with AHSA1/START domain